MIRHNRQRFYLQFDLYKATPSFVESSSDQITLGKINEFQISTNQVLQ